MLGIAIWVWNSIRTSGTAPSSDCLVLKADSGFILLADGTSELLKADCS